jgi:Fe-S-cluster containining protein
MVNLSAQYDNLKLKYRKIFTSCISEMNTYLGAKYNVDLDILLSGKLVDNEVLNIIGDISKKIQQEIELIKSNCVNFRNDCKCSGCGACCKFAVSEFSPDELKIKAQNDDEFAKQFLSVFELYSTKELASLVFPEYVKLLDKYTDGKYYIYHCPKVTEDNRCPDYENRPQICRDFPDNPVSFIPIDCGYNLWKMKSEDLMLKARALAEILDALLNSFSLNKK